MMSVVDMSKMRLIKKHIFLLLGLFFSCSQIGAMSCMQTMGPISLTQGIWDVLLRVGQTQNVIQSQICAIDCNFTVTTIVYPNPGVGCICDCIQFGQSDIGAGGVYTINSPGLYCMYNDAIFTTGAAITVNASNVTIDMQNHTLNAGSHSGTTGIVINGGVNNITIKNGNIVNPTVACIANDSSVALLSDIIIQNMNFSVVGGTTSYPGVLMQQNAVTAQFNSLLIENCTGYNCYISLNGGSSCVVRGCSLVAALANGNASITISGSVGYNTQLALVEDCTLVNEAVAYPAGVAGFSLQFVLMAVIRNCISSGSGSVAAGFDVENFVNATVLNCVAQKSASQGFLFLSGTTAANLSVNNCLAQECLSGFWVKTLSGPGYKSALLTNCVAQDNTEFGFFITNDGIGSTSFSCMNCTANGNAADGFSIGIGGISTAPIGYGVLSECSASKNGGDGFYLSSQSIEFVIEHCNAVSNAGYGFFDQNQSSPSTYYYIGCRALANGTAGYSGDVQAQFSYEPGPVDYGMNLYSH